MAPKRAKFYSYGNDELCNEIKKFIEDAGVILQVRDIGENPLSVEELRRLLGHLQIEHFLNPLSESFKKNKLDQKLPERREILALMADDHTLIRRPIIISSRLVTVGCDRRKIADMLQIPTESSQEAAVPKGGRARKVSA
jgi:arsenate reductase